VPTGIPRATSGYRRHYESLISDTTTLVRIGLEPYGVKSWASSYGRLSPADISILGDTTQVLSALTQHCREAMDGGIQQRVAARSARATQIHTTLYDRIQKELRDRWWAQQPISTARLAAEIWQTIRNEDWVLVHGSLSGWERRVWDMQNGARSIAGGGGTGTGMGVAHGAALAFRHTDKICVSIQNDGDFLHTPGSIWTAAHYDIPMLVVMFNNRSYYQDVGHQTAITRMRERSLENVGVGVNLDKPATDFAMLARSFGLYGAGPIVHPDDIHAALAQGVQVVKQERRLARIDTITQPR
jgi:acetolactate synthase-1/2/3 large subunit